jgi:6,7-dimethyl-8-ribityllumazine synthase
MMRTLRDRDARVCPQPPLTPAASASPLLLPRLQVPGSYELVYGAKALIASSNVDAVLCIGCLIKGDTMHFEYICEAVTQGIMRLNVDSSPALNPTNVPVIFGVLAVLNEEQAKARAGLLPGKHNHGVEWAVSALQMAAIRKASGLGGK